jgi:hypothetical protein
MPTATRNTVEIDVTNEPLAGLPQHPRYMHPHTVFSLGESCALDDLKRLVDGRIDALATPLLSTRNKVAGVTAVATLRLAFRVARFNAERAFSLDSANSVRDFNGGTSSLDGQGP